MEIGCRCTASRSAISTGIRTKEAMPELRAVDVFMEKVLRPQTNILTHSSSKAVVGKGKDHAKSIAAEFGGQPSTPSLGVNAAKIERNKNEVERNYKCHKHP